MDAKNAVCPQCGAQGTAGRFCEYCGAKIPMPVVKNAQDSTSAKNERRIIPFDPDINEESIKAMVLEKLIDTNYVPLDVFDKMEEFSAIKAFYPMYNFTGSFQSSWSCTQVIEVKKLRDVYKNGERRTETYYEKEYHPASGISTGQFDILCSSDPERMRANFYDFHNYNNSVLFDDSLVDEDAVLFPFEKEELISWNSVAKEIIEKLAFLAAYRQAPTPNEGFSQSASWSKDSEGTEVYVPIWAVSFQYEGDTYGAFLRGDHPIADEIRIPQDKNSESHTEEVLKKKKNEAVLAIRLFGLFTLIIGGFGLCYYLFSGGNWNTFVDLPGLIIIVCSLIAIFVIGITYQHVSKRNQEIDEYINDIHQNTKLIRQANAKRVFDFGDAETDTSNIDISSLKEPEKASLALAWITLLVMSLALWFCYIVIPANERAERERRNAAYEAEMQEMAQKQAIIKDENAKELAERIQKRMIQVKGGSFEVPEVFDQTEYLTDFCIMEAPITYKEWKLLESGEYSPKKIDDFIKRLNKASSNSFSLPTPLQWQYASEHSAIKKADERELCKDSEQSCIISRSNINGKFYYYIDYHYSEYLEPGFRLVMKRK